MVLVGVALGAVVGACTSFGSDTGDAPDASADAAVGSDGGVSLPDGSTSDATLEAGPPRAWKAIFVSRGTTTGDFSLREDRFGRADAICQGEANDARLVGSFVALVRPGPSGALVDRAKVGNGESGERFVPLPGAEKGRLGIRLTPLDVASVEVRAYADGAEVRESIFVWTGGIDPQSRSGTCRKNDAEDWRDSTEDGLGLIGDPLQNGKAALEIAGDSGCDESHHLYCVER
jgi:hypothetical protein